MTITFFVVCCQFFLTISMLLSSLSADGYVTDYGNSTQSNEAYVRHCFENENDLCSHGSNSTSRRNLKERSQERSLEEFQLKERAKVTYEKVLPCLQRSRTMKKWGVENFVFPDDAEEHYRDLIKKAEKFRVAKVHHYKGYKGPWIENLFISEYMNKPLSFFNGLIPLFIQWIDTDILSKQDAVDINTFLTKELRKDVLYVAISQGDIGLGQAGIDHPNILAMSAGGFGHVPLPLIKGELRYRPPPEQYKRSFLFYGDPTFATRQKSLANLKSSLEFHNITHLFGRGEDWTRQMLRSKVNIAPRGNGRNSFRFAESIQMGRVPFFVFDDIPWLPYEGTEFEIKTYGFAGSIIPRGNHGTLDDVVVTFQNMTDDQYLRKLINVKKVRRAFTYQGVFEEFESFLQDPFGPDGGHLRCIKQPKTLKCCG